ncbi:cytochrome P450 CYP736A12-like isoform X3 [Durio zibethinus]|uniref:Cytochrome P450 CYP736A12-like isoform X3 n=2 Tax=Durio zibethinus TaxID=66656 RepID=A0A6P6BCR6_DURZI|nr:cytochrome P450 CYP736A12-like isoform X3 [Durio zibethinus]
MVDIFAQEYVDQLSELQDQVPPFPSETAISIVEEELGGPVDDIFDMFDFEPIAAASLGNLNVLYDSLMWKFFAIALRPPHEGAKHVGYNQQNLSSSPYGSYWRNMHKLCTLELLRSLKIDSFSSMRKEELLLLIQYIQGAASARVAVDLSAKFSSLSTDISSRMVLGKKYNNDDFNKKGFEAIIREGMQTIAAFNLADYIPQIKGLDLEGLTKHLKTIAKVFDDFFEKIIGELVQSKGENRIVDFIDVMLGFIGSEETDEYHVERDNMKAIISDMLVASMDTSAAAIEWTLSELIRHLRVTKEVQKELENVVGMERMVEESDLEKLMYSDMVVKESFRFHPVGL